MSDLFPSALHGTPAMNALTLVVLLIEGASLLVLLVNVRMFRSQANRYRAFFSGLGDERAWGNPGRFLIPTYVIMTCAATVLTTAIFLWQPHLL